MRSKQNLTREAKLLLEECIKGFTSGLRLGSAGMRRSLSFDTLLGSEKLTLVTKVLARNSFRDRLGTFEARRGVEKCALFAGMQICLAFRTLALQLNLHGDGCATHRAAIGLMKTRHLAWPELLGASWRAWFPLGLLLPVTITVHVTTLPVLALHDFVLRRIIVCNDSSS
jgi:hypothetical protein